MESLPLVIPGQFDGGLALHGDPIIRSEVKNFFSKGGLAVGALISEETFQFLGIIFSIFAYAIGSVTLVSSIGALQPIMTVLLILGLGILTPKLARVMNEKTDWSSLKQKGISFHGGSDRHILYELTQGLVEKRPAKSAIATKPRQDGFKALARHLDSTGGL